MEGVIKSVRLPGPERQPHSWTDFVTFSVTVLTGGHGMMKSKMKMKDILMLQAIFLIYSINSIVAKLASGEERFSIMFFVFYGIELGILGVYAVLWQQAIKRFELSVAYANKAVTLIWALIWGKLIFNERITISKIAGILLVIAGIVILNSGKEAAE